MRIVFIFSGIISEFFFYFGRKSRGVFKESLKRRMSGCVKEILSKV